MAGIVLIYNVSGAILNFGSDYVSDYYHLWRVEQYVEEASEIEQNPNIDPKIKQKYIDFLKDQAHQHNSKVRRMIDVSPDIINTLDVRRLHISKNRNYHRDHPLKPAPASGNTDGQ